MTPSLDLSRRRKLGSFEVGRLAYGCWRFAGTAVEDARAKLEAALEIGASLIDTADIYGYGETGFGEAEERLGDLFAATPGLREKVTLVTKGGITPPAPYNSGKEYLISAAEASLTRLKTDVIDIYLIHRPDLLSAPEEVADALATLRAEGKIREAGVSNYTVAQTRALQSFIDFPLAAMQPEISALTLDALFDGTLDLALECGLTPMAWSPLAGGALATGRANGGDEARLVRIVEALDAIAAENETGRDAVGLAWLLAHPAGIIPIVGSQNPERIRAASAAFDVKITRRQWYGVLEASLGAPMP